MKASVWRRSSSATIEGEVRSVETTLTRTPSRWTASISRRKIAVAREQDDVVDLPGHLHHVDGDLDIHVALDLPPPHRVGELLGGLGDHRVAVVVEPVDQRADRRVFLILQQGGVVERAHQTPLGTEEFQQFPVVDVEAERARRRIKVRAVDEDGDALFGMKVHGLGFCLSLHGPAGCGGNRGRVSVWEPVVRALSCRQSNEGTEIVAKDSTGAMERLSALIAEIEGESLCPRAG